MAKKGKVYMLQISNDIIRNQNGFNFNENEFALICSLKYCFFVNRCNEENNEVVFDYKMLMASGGVKHINTFKNYLQNLKKQNIIMNDEIKIDRKGRLPLLINDGLIKGKTFTSMPVKLMNRMIEITRIGFRLMFYYQSFINTRDDSNKIYAYPSIKKICDDLRLSKKTVIKYNKLLEKNKLLRVEPSKIKFEGYDLENIPIFQKHNNHYYVLLENI